MTVAFESGYTLPSGDLPLNHARVLHDGNRFKVKTVTASDELALYPGTVANSGDTVDRWRPFANEITDPSDFSTANWTKDDITVATDGQTLIENSDVAQLHSLTYTPSLPTTGVEVTTSCKVSLSNERSQFRIRCSDGTSVFSCVFDLADETTNAGNATAKIRKLGGRVYECSITYTPLAVSNLNVQFWFYKNDQFFYDGDGVSGYKLLRFSHHASEATLTYDLFTAQEGDTFAIAAHNLWSSGATLNVPGRELVTNGNDWTGASGATPPTGWTAFGLSTFSVSSGQLTVTRSGAGNVGLGVQLSGISTGKLYRLQFDLISETGGGLSYVFESPTGSFTSRTDLITPFTLSPQSYVIYGVAQSNNPFISFYTGASDSTFTIDNASVQEVVEISPADNSPIMLFVEPRTSATWSITVSGGALPEIGVFRVGKSLQMERPFYGGFTIPRMARNTVVRGNISGSGELLGRSKERTTLRTQYQWQHLSYDWVRANLDGPTGLIQAAESEPVFLAWRPSVTQDVDYIMRASTDAPNAMGLRDLWTFGMSGEAHSYE